MTDEKKDTSSSALPASSTDISAPGSAAPAPSADATASKGDKKLSEKLGDKGKGISDWAAKFKKNMAEDNLRRKEEEAKKAENDPNPIRAQMARFELLMTKFMTFRDEKFKELFDKFVEWCNKNNQNPNEPSGILARRELLDKQLGLNNVDIIEAHKELSELERQSETISDEFYGDVDQRKTKELEEKLAQLESKKEQLKAVINEVNGKNQVLNEEYKKLSKGKDAPNYIEPEELSILADDDIQTLHKEWSNLDEKEKELETEIRATPKGFKVSDDLMQDKLTLHAAKEKINEELKEKLSGGKDADNSKLQPRLTALSSSPKDQVILLPAGNVEARKLDAKEPEKSAELDDIKSEDQEPWHGID